MNSLFNDLYNNIPSSITGTVYESIYKTFLSYLDQKHGSQLDNYINIRSEDNTSEILKDNLKNLGFKPKCLSRIKPEKYSLLLDYLPKFYSKKGRGSIVIFDTYKYSEKYLSTLTNPNDNYQHGFVLSKSLLNRNSELH